MEIVHLCSHIHTHKACLFYLGTWLFINSALSSSNCERLPASSSWTTGDANDQIPSGHSHDIKNESLLLSGPEYVTLMGCFALMMEAFCACETSVSLSDTATALHLRRQLSTGWKCNWLKTVKYPVRIQAGTGITLTEFFVDFNRR